MGKILVVGSLAYDSLTTPAGKVQRVLGGSANYFAMSASLFAPVQVVGVVGDDYQSEHKQMLVNRGVDVKGIEHVRGKTFHWEGAYGNDLNEAKSLKTELNVFEYFHPKLPSGFDSSEYVFLANIDPILQAEVLAQISKPKLIVADTMNFWIQTKILDLSAMLKRIHILLINEGEAKQLTQTSNAVAAAEKIVEMGPKSVVIKRGEYGFLLYSMGKCFALPAYPLKTVIDPTGAGDTFAGGFMGYLAKFDLAGNLGALKMASVYGTLMASFTVQDFGLRALESLTMNQFERRHLEFREIVSVNV